MGFKVWMCLAILIIGTFSQLAASKSIDKWEDEDYYPREKRDTETTTPATTTTTEITVEETTFITTTPESKVKRDSDTESDNPTTTIVPIGNGEVDDLLVKPLEDEKKDKSSKKKPNKSKAPGEIDTRLSADDPLASQPPGAILPGPYQGQNFAYSRPGYSASQAFSGPYQYQNTVPYNQYQQYNSPDVYAMQQYFQQLAYQQQLFQEQIAAQQQQQALWNQNLLDSRYGSNGASASSSIGLGPQGGYQTGQISPASPGIASRFGESLSAPSGGNYGVFSSSSSSSGVGADGKPQSYKSATTGVNDNGKITFRTVRD